MTHREYDVTVIGAGQSGLATAFYLRRAGLEPQRDFVLVDAADRAGGSWPRMWDSLRLFSPATYSSLPGWMSARHSPDSTQRCGTSKTRRPRA